MQILQADKQMGFMTILSMDDMDIRGSQIWVGFKDHCKSDVAAFMKAINDRDPAMVATINAAYYDGDRDGRGTVPRAVEHGASFKRGVSHAY